MLGATRFMQQLHAYCRAVDEYENPQWQREALQRIPSQTLQERANKARQLHLSLTQTTLIPTIADAAWCRAIPAVPCSG